MGKVTRRKFLVQGSSSIVPLLIGAGSAHAGSPGDGVSVWRNMDQNALDASYAPSTYAPNFRQILARLSSNSEIVRNRIGNPKRFSYGEKMIESVDVFSTAKCNEPAPIHIFIHGGAWRQGSAAGHAFPAELFVKSGVHFVVLDFSWVQDVGDSLFPIVDQVRQAVMWVYRNADRFGGDPDRIYLSGHSSGAHLAGVLLTTNWKGEFGLPADLIKGALCCSGMFDLTPVRLSARRKYIAFTDEMVEALSPMRHIDKLNAPLIVAYGSYESPDFIHQSQAFATAVQAAGKPVQLIVGENYNHFEVIETLANPYGILGSAFLGLMNLKA